MRRSILLPLSLLMVLVAVPGVAQELETLNVRVVAFEGYSPAILEYLQLSIDPTIDLAGCTAPMSLANEQFRVEAPDLGFDTSQEPFFFLSVTATPIVDPGTYGGEPFTELLFLGFTSEMRSVGFFVDLPGEVCEGPVPLDWSEALGGTFELADLTSNTPTQWAGFVESVGGTPESDEFLSCADEGLKGALFGLCNAYCEAMMCGTDDQQASDKACSAVARNYAKKSGGNAPPCVGRN